MAKATVKVTGVNRAVAKLKRIPRGMTTNELGGILMEASRPMVEAARARAPRGTEPLRGRNLRLYQAIQAEQTRGKAEVAIGAGRRAPHANLQEFGTRHHAATPFLRPAFAEQKGNAVRVAKKRLAALVRREVR